MPVKSVQKYEADLLAHLRGEQSALLSNIATGKKLTDELEITLRSVLDAFTSSFEA